MRFAAQFCLRRGGVSDLLLRRRLTRSASSSRSAIRASARSCRERSPDQARRYPSTAEAPSKRCYHRPATRATCCSALALTPPTASTNCSRSMETRRSPHGYARASLVGRSHRDRVSGDARRATGCRLSCASSARGCGTSVGRGNPLRVDFLHGLSRHPEVEIVDRRDFWRVCVELFDSVAATSAWALALDGVDPGAGG